MSLYIIKNNQLINKLFIFLFKKNMFCRDVDTQMTCRESMLQEILSIISFICSLFVIIISCKKLKKNLMNILIIQILISEMIDEVNILLSIIADAQGNINFQNYHGRMIVCYSQIFIAVFSCLWTLTASFFISLKLYDIIINKNKIFSEGSVMSKYTPLFTIAGSAVISYIIWFIQVLKQASSFSFDETYDKEKHRNKPPKNFKMGFCWVDIYLSITLSILATSLIFGSFYFSIVKGCCFIKQTKEKLQGNNVGRRANVRKKINNMNQIQTTLFLYPTVACLLWAFFFILKLFFDLSKENKRNTVFSWFFSVFISVRQIIYTLVCFLTQPKLKEYAWEVITCKTCKRRKKGKIRISKDLLNNNGEKKVEPLLEENEI